MGLIGFVVAIINIFLHQVCCSDKLSVANLWQFISLFVRHKYEALDKQIEQGNYTYGWLITIAISVVCQLQRLPFA